MDASRSEEPARPLASCRSRRSALSGVAFVKSALLGSRKLGAGSGSGSKKSRSVPTLRMVSTVKEKSRDASFPRRYFTQTAQIEPAPLPAHRTRVTVSRHQALSDSADPFSPLVSPVRVRYRRRRLPPIRRMPPSSMSENGSRAVLARPEATFPAHPGPRNSDVSFPGTPTDVLFVSANSSRDSGCLKRARILNVATAIEPSLHRCPFVAAVPSRAPPRTPAKVQTRRS
jgi:hypothetical protein